MSPALNSEDLPDAELDVLAALHNRGELTIRGVREALEAHRPMSHGAAATLLGRLEAKGLVARMDRKSGKAFFYRACGRPARTLRARLDGLVERLFGGDRVGLVSTLFEGRRPTEDQIAELENLLAELKRKRRGSGR
jgi:BlaI family transcriptional regulator, penicillinase repressor